MSEQSVLRPRADCPLEMSSGEAAPQGRDALCALLQKQGSPLSARGRGAQRNGPDPLSVRERTSALRKDCTAAREGGTDRLCRAGRRLGCCSEAGEQRTETLSAHKLHRPWPEPCGTRD